MNDKKFAFTTDLHGNLDNVDLFLSEAATRKTRYVVFGGDIAPKQMAIETSDHKAYILEHPTSFTQHLSMLEDDAQDAHRKGYILIKTEENAQELEQLYSIASKLAEWSLRRESAPFCSWQREDFEVMEKRIARLFVDHVAGSEQAGKLYRELLSRLRIVKKNYNPKPADIWRGFVNNQKISFLQAKRISLSAPEAAELLHIKNPSSQKELIEITDECFSLKDNYNNLLHNFSSDCDYFKKWADIERDLPSHSLAGQQKNAQDMIRRIAEFTAQTKAKVVTLLGNDDHRELEAEFLRAENQGILQYSGNRVVQLDDEVQVLGYSHILPLPYEFDEWYKEEDEIARDLEGLGRQLREGVRLTLFNIHMPPSKTGLALGKIKSPDVEDWGSDAVRAFIERKKPSHVFTGHLHESWMISGKTQDSIGKSHIYNPGASIVRPRFLYGDLEAPGSEELFT